MRRIAEKGLAMPSRLALNLRCPTEALTPRWSLAQVAYVTSLTPSGRPPWDGGLMPALFGIHA